MQAPRVHVGAARTALREIATAQELYSAAHEGRYVGTLAELVAMSTELEPRLAPSTGIVASITADTTGSWYEAEVQHRRLPGWSCRIATEGPPATSTGEVTAGMQACDPVPSGES